MMTKKSNIQTILYSTAGVGVMFLILVAVNVIGGFVKDRVDLTADKEYTLSSGTLAILDKLDTPVTIRFYCTRNERIMPVAFKNYAQQVEDLLDEYRQRAHGYLQIKKLDPLPDSDAEDSANLDGVTGQMTDSGDKLYLGLAVSCLDQKEAIPFLSPRRARLLEYDISRAIANVINPQKPVIGVMSALPVFGQMNPMMMRMGQPRQEPWEFLTELKSAYTVKEVDLNADKIDHDIKVLLVVYPKGISDATQYAIDQFVLRGGKLIAFLDPLSIVDSRSNPSNPLQGAMNSGASLDKLLKAWGLSFDVNKVVADMNFMSRINRDMRTESAPAVLSMTTAGIDRDDVVTGPLDNLLLLFPGAFTGTPAAGLKETVLLKSTKESQLVEKFSAEFSGEQIVKDFASSGREYPLAVRLTGKFKTAFPDGEPKAADQSTNKTETASTQPQLRESKGQGVVVLVGDSDLLYDQFAAQVESLFGQRIVIPRNGNLNLVQNAVDQLAGDSDLIAVRSRATINRPFTVVNQMKAEAEDRYRSRIKELEQSLSETQSSLSQLQQAKPKGTGQRFILSPEQQAQIQQFRQKEATVNKQLKEVRRDLRRDIDSLENRLKWLNIAGMPFLVTVSGLALAFFKRKRTAAK
jgi:gliding motility-associatede transport system auxiliary component